MERDFGVLVKGQPFVEDGHRLFVLLVGGVQGKADLDVGHLIAEAVPRFVVFLDHLKGFLPAWGFLKEFGEFVDLGDFLLDGRDAEGPLFERFQLFAHRNDSLLMNKALLFLSPEAFFRGWAR